jgi:hypothetical protein
MMPINRESNDFPVLRHGACQHVSNAVNMARNNMSAESTVCLNRAFKVHPITRESLPKARVIDRLGHDISRERFIIKFRHGQTHTANGDGTTQCRIADHEWTNDSNSRRIPSKELKGGQRSHFFDYAREHVSSHLL